MIALRTHYELLRLIAAEKLAEEQQGSLLHVVHCISLKVLVYSHTQATSTTTVYFNNVDLYLRMDFTFFSVIPY